MNYSQMVYLLAERRGSFKCVHYIFWKVYNAKKWLMRKNILESKDASERGEGASIQVSCRAGSTVSISNIGSCHFESLKSL